MFLVELLTNFSYSYIQDFTDYTKRNHFCCPGSDSTCTLSQIFRTDVRTMSKLNVPTPLKWRHKIEN